MSCGRAMTWLPLFSIWVDVFLLSNIYYQAYTTYTIMLKLALFLYLCNVLTQDLLYYVLVLVVSYAAVVDMEI